ncbi:MAG: hypothetical protein AB1798_01660 [Spirochaetota bacterium]
MNQTIFKKCDLTVKKEVDSAQLDRLLNAVAEAFKMKGGEKTHFVNKNIARLIAGLPFLAGCEDPERTAIAHLGTYLLSIRCKAIANCKPSDDIHLSKRLALVNNFIGGDRQILDRGMSLLALSMLSDYKRDVAEDRQLGKYNPVGSGAVSFEAEKAELLETINSVACPEMDKILSADEAVLIPWEPDKSR